MKFREIVANSSLIIPHIILLQFVLILGAVTPKNSSCTNLLKTQNQKSVKILKTEPDKTQRWRNWNQNLMNFQKPVEPEP